MRIRGPAAVRAVVAAVAVTLVPVFAEELPGAGALERARLETLPPAGVARPADPGRIELPTGALGLEARIGEARSRFVRVHLMPRMARQFDKLGPLDETRLHGRQVIEDIAYTERLGERTQEMVESATGKAVQYFLLEETTLSRVVDAFESAADRVEGRAAAAIAKPGGGFKLDLGVAHGAPQLQLRRRTANGWLRLSLGSRGDVAVRMHHVRFGNRARVVARLDPSRDDYRVSCSLDF